MIGDRINISTYGPLGRGERLLSDDERSGGYEGSTSSYEYDEEFEMLVKAYMRDMNYTNLNQAALNVVYSLLNAGLVALPFVVQEAGVPLFILVFGAVSLIAAYTSVMVIKMANEKRVRTLEDLADCAFGLKGFFLVSICQIIYSFSLMCITLDIWSDIMGDVFTEMKMGGWFLQSRTGEVLFGALLVLPFCIMKKSMSSMRWTSYVAVFAAVFALMAVIATYVTDNDLADNIFTHENAIKMVKPKQDWWALIFIAIFCYSCNQKVLIIYSSLRRRSAERWRKATFRASLTVTLIYFIFGLSGYVSKLRKDIRLDSFNFFMDNSDERKEVFDPARAMVAFSLLMTIPVDCLVSATTWRRMYSKYIRRNEVYDGSQNDEYLREVTCCDLIYPPTAEAKLTPAESLSTGLPTAEQVEQAELNHDSSDEDNIEVNTMGVSGGPSGGKRSPPVESSFKKQTLSRSSRPRRRFRRTKRANTSGSIKFDNSWSGGSSSQITASSGTWSVFRNIFGFSTGRGNVEYDKVPDTDVEDPRLSALRESINEYEGHDFTNNNNQIKDGVLPNNTSLSGGVSGQDRNSFNGLPNNLTNSTMNATDGRASSLDQQMFGELLDEDTPFLPTRNEFIPTIILWGSCLGVCLVIQHWMYVAATFSIISIIFLMFIFPSTMYFRLGLLSDYQAIPLFGEVLPNRLYMSIVKYLGISLLIFDVLLMACLVATGQNVIQKES